MAPTRATPPTRSLEAVLHSEVYRRRDDVGAIVHGHPPYATAFAATDAEPLGLAHDARNFDRGLAVYDGSPDLITEPEQGAEVAEALGERPVVLLRNHGVLVAERDLPWMVLAAVTLERAVMLQSIATRLGAPRPIDATLIDDLHRRKYNDGLVDEYWRHRLRLRPARPGRRHGAWPVPEVATLVVVNADPRELVVPAAGTAARRAARAPRAHRGEALLRRAGLRDLHGARRRRAGELLHVPACDADGREVLTIEGFAESADFASSSARSPIAPRCSAASARPASC